MLITLDSAALNASSALF